jgi:hypothetical protein
VDQAVTVVDMDLIHGVVLVKAQITYMAALTVAAVGHQALDGQVQQAMVTME